MPNQTLCDKYRPKNFSEIKGQDFAIEKLKLFMKNFPKKKSIVLHGETGTGKTSLAYALSYETNFELLELNASDLRNQEEIKKIIGQASQQVSLFGKGKILLIDEIDGITKEDKGGLQELISLIETTNFPIIITSNNIWDRKFSELRKRSELLEIKELNYQFIFDILEFISEQEKIKISEDFLKSIAIKSKGDVRAAINDLQAMGEDIINLDERDKKENIFNIIREILQNTPRDSILELYEKIDMPLDEILLWIEENIPNVYNGEDLYKAFDSLSKADVFRGRIHRQQYWRFLVYQNFFLSYGISYPKTQANTRFIRYQRPTRILKIWTINQKQKMKKQIAEKYAYYCHVSIKRALREFPIIKKLLEKDNIRKELKLDGEEIEFLKNS